MRFLGCLHRRRAPKKRILKINRQNWKE